MKTDEEVVLIAAMLRKLADRLDQRDVEVIGCRWHSTQKDSTTLILTLSEYQEPAQAEN